MSCLSDQEQHDRLTRMQFHRSDEVEFDVRKMAEIAVDRPETYSTGTYFPAKPQPFRYWSEDEMLLPEIPKTLCVRLVPKLQYHRGPALLVAEQILRRQVLEHMGLAE